MARPHAASRLSIADRASHCALSPTPRLACTLAGPFLTAAVAIAISTATTTAAASGYLYAAGGSLACPPGSARVLDDAGCRAAAAEEGKVFKALNSATYPSGCWKYTSRITRYLYPATLSSGNIYLNTYGYLNTAVDGQAQSSAQVACSMGGAEPATTTATTTVKQVRTSTTPVITTTPTANADTWNDVKLRYLQDPCLVRPFIRRVWGECWGDVLSACGVNAGGTCFTCALQPSEWLQAAFERDSPP